MNTHLYQPDASQLAVIHAQGTALRIVAPAGSGKTETLVRRVIHRIEHDGIDPRRILMLTFDTNGQQALKRMLRKLGRTRGYPTFQTFNKFGVDILREFFPGEAVETIPASEARALGRALGDVPILTWDERERDAAGLFRALKDQGFRPDARDRNRATTWIRTKFLELPQDAETGERVDFGVHEAPGAATPDGDVPAQLDALFENYLRYDAGLRARGRMDLQDQKLRPLTRLIRCKHTNGPDHRIYEEITARYDEIIVDEAQDISRLDALLIWHVMGPQTTITLAGDDDQTIYEFKQASSVFLRDANRYFEREFETFKLNINYRSPHGILVPAQRLIAHNVERIEKSVAAARHDEGEIVVLPRPTDAARIAAVVDWIAAQAGDEDRRFAWGDVGILVPATRHLDPIMAALAARKIPARLNTGTNDNGRLVDAVELGTIHKAKGRQWRVVILAMSGEGEMPDLRNVRQGNLEAERRAYYVSMSRAADVLIVAYVREGEQDTLTRAVSGEVIGTSGASRFLFEAGIVTDATASTGAGTASPSHSPLVERLRQRNASGQRRIGRIGLNGTHPPAPVAPGPSPEVVASPPSPPPDGRPPVPVAIVTPPDVEEEAAPAPGKASHLDLVAKAERNLAGGEYEYALYDGWRVVVDILNLLDDGTQGDRPEAFQLINRLEMTGTMSRAWAKRLHQWRITRNRGFKENTFDRSAIEHLVKGLRPLLAEIARIHPPATPAAPIPAPAPTIPVPVPTPAAAAAAAVAAAATPEPDNASPTAKLYKLPTERVMHVLQVLDAGGYDPERGRVIRQIGFHTVNAGVEFLPLQLGLILFGIRYFVPGEFRYNRSPIFARFCTAVGGELLPKHVQGVSKQPVRADLRPFEPAIHGLMHEVLEAYRALVHGVVDVEALLANRLEAADVLENGQQTGGVILEPLPSARYPRPGWSRR